jgi:DNA gyrase subunit A
LRRLAALERKKILDEYAEVLKLIAHYEDLLAYPKKVLALVKDDMIELKKKHGDERRTRIAEGVATDFTVEDLIPDQEVVVTLSDRGYVKRVPSDTYRSQNRGGKGVRGQATKESDAIRHLMIANTHDSILFFTNRGRVFQLKCHELPDASRQAKGVPIINLISIEANELVTAAVVIRTFDRDFMVMATKLGEVKKTKLEEFSAVRSNGLIAMDLEPGDELIAAKLCRLRDDLILVSQRGQAIRFEESQLRSASRTSGGVRGMRIEDEDDRLITMEVVESDGFLLVITANGIGKRTPVGEYPKHGRGGSGVRTQVVNVKTGPVAAAKVVHPQQEVMLISAEGIVIRTPIEAISKLGRSSQGVAVMKTAPNDSVVAIAALAGSSEAPVRGAGGRNGGRGEGDGNGRRASALAETVVQAKRKRTTEDG